MDKTQSHASHDEITEPNIGKRVNCSGPHGEKPVYLVRIAGPTLAAPLHVGKKAR